jgi:hypothetical protein
MMRTVSYVVGEMREKSDISMDMASLSSRVLRLQEVLTVAEGGMIRYFSRCEHMDGVLPFIARADRWGRATGNPLRVVGEQWIRERVCRPGEPIRRVKNASSVGRCIQLMFSRCR